MIGKKIKALLMLKNKNTKNACSTLGILEATYYRKINRNTFKVEELIKLAVIDENDKPLIKFDKYDLDEGK